jgi:uncharacterized protein (TIGR00369 family)
MSDSPLESLRPLIGTTMAQSPSPLGRWLGGTLRDVHDDGLSVEYVVREEMTNPVKMLHGGVISAMIDDLIGMTLMLMTGDYHASISLSVDFLRSARVGDIVVCRSRVIRQGRSVVHAEATLTQPDGKLLARAMTNLLNMG